VSVRRPTRTRRDELPSDLRSRSCCDQGIGCKGESDGEKAFRTEISNKNKIIREIDEFAISSHFGRFTIYEFLALTLTYDLGDFDLL
jgi:hypothetical protein